MPEMLRDEWGRLVAAGDSDALAAAIADLLALPPEERAEMGRRGREYVIRNFTVRDEALKLIAILERE
jgi:glycosyltransferase involved in cell wall biosynthesis